jgi:CSLREA domain-containing protein
MNLRRRVALTLLAALSILAFPTAASAVQYTVNSTGDQEDASPGTGGCATSVPTCTLRAAIEESNASTSVTDEILFSSAFDGELADSTIAVGFALPDIEDEVTIDGDANGQCETDAGVDGPCVGVKGESRFEVQADEVTIDGLAITDSQLAITVEGEEFEAHDDWIGIELDGTDGPGEQSYGIFVAPHADHAVIGGTADAERNVFGNTNSALLLRGSSFGTVQGNYFGVGPNGTTTAPNGRNLVVANKLELGSEVEATDNQIGADVGEAGTATDECDFGCNVFAAQAGATAAVNLVGTPSEEEGPATGPTQVEGNYVGLDATGSEVTNGATFDVLVGSAGGVTIGGEGNGQANYIVGGGTGIYHQDGEEFAAIGNVIGDGRTAADVKAPGLGMFVYCLELGTESVEAVTVSKNVFDMEGGKGIEQVFGNAEIEDNFIEGAELGIFTKGDPPGAGNLIKDNVIGESTANGILIESDFNNVLHNSIYGSGEAGVRIQDPIAFPLVITTGNLVGGDSAAEENTIRESGDDAIQIVDESGNTEEDSQNTVARNKGDSNAGRFISLIGDPNGGIEPPQISSAGKTEASGTAEPFALVRVFRKASAENGELAAFLEEATADAGGNWSVTYATLPGSTLVTATQTNTEGGTSELADPVATPADPSPPTPGGGGSGGNKGGSGGTTDKTAPTTKITKAPKAKSTSTTAKFKFKSNEAGSKFQCKLDKGKFKNCRSPKTYKKLKPGKHVFKVRAIDKAGNVGKPAKRKFKVEVGD